MVRKLTLILKDYVSSVWKNVWALKEFDDIRDLRVYRVLLTITALICFAGVGLCLYVLIPIVLFIGSPSDGRIRTQGKVVESSAGRLVYSFTTDDGIKKTAVCDYSKIQSKCDGDYALDFSDLEKYSVGDIVDVYYLPDNSADSFFLDVIRIPPKTWLSLFVLLVGNLLFVGIGILFLCKVVRYKQVLIQLRESQAAVTETGKGRGEG